MNYDTIYEFVEPHMYGGESTVRMTARQVVEWERKVHRQYCDLPEPCDEELLADFISVHWASPAKELNLREQNARLLQLLREVDQALPAFPTNTFQTIVAEGVIRAHALIATEAAKELKDQ